MGTNRDTVTYDLIHHRKIVSRGTTHDPETREEQHKNEGEVFDTLRITSRRMTEEGANEKEAEALETYRSSHSGKNPRYNKNTDG